MLPLLNNSRSWPFTPVKLLTPMKVKSSSPAAPLGIDAGKVDLVLPCVKSVIRSRCEPLAPLSESATKYEEIGARTAGKDIPAAKAG